MIKYLKIAFFGLIVKPIVFVVLGLNIRNRHYLPTQGPCLIAANHNSHLDTLVLMSLFPLKCIPHIRPVAAADYFLANKWLAWFSLNILGIIPMYRQAQSSSRSVFNGCHQALDENAILIVFPEGSRGAPEEISPLKRGIFHLANRDPWVPVVPVVLHGLGRALPKGEALLVPFNCDVVMGEPIAHPLSSEALMHHLNDAFREQLEACLTRSQDSF